MPSMPSSMPPPRPLPSEAALARHLPAAAPPLQPMMPLPPRQQMMSSSVVGGGGPWQPITPANANAVRLHAVMLRADELLCRGVRSDKLGQLFTFMSRGIDFAIACNDVPLIAEHLPHLVKKIYKQRNDMPPQVKAAITVLLITMKSAVQSGWFPTVDTTELLDMSNELCNSFCLTANVTTEMSDVHDAKDIILKIIPRFYPQLKLGRLIASFVAKQGYNCLFGDFIIQRNALPDEKILLFVAQTENTETSSCIKTPPNVSFLINGMGVGRRTIVSLDNGPQLPSDITNMTMYGSNSIQAIGNFTSDYIIAISSMGKGAPTATLLDDYVHAVVGTTLDPDSEIIEGASEVSLNCPLSLSRIKTPVKGHLCKHHQCFDYDNFIEMNSRKPSWRCPCCNQSVSCTDLSIDQRMVKILCEVGDAISNVMISCDGAWEIVEQKNTTDHADDRNMKFKSTRSLNTLSKMMDLSAEEDSECNRVSDQQVEHANRSLNQATSGGEAVDRKPFTRCLVNPDHMFPPRPIDSRTDGSLHSLVANWLPNPAVTNATFPAPAQASLQFPGSSFPRNASQMQLPENMSAQHPPRGRCTVNNETERLTMLRSVSGIPMVVASYQQSPAVQTTQPGFNMASCNIGMQQTPGTNGGTSNQPQTRTMTQGDQHMRSLALQHQGRLQAAGDRTRTLSDQQRGACTFRSGVSLPYDHQNTYRQLQNLQSQSTSQFTGTSQHVTPSRQVPLISHDATSVTVESFRNQSNQGAAARHTAHLMGFKGVSSPATTTTRHSSSMMPDSSRPTNYTQLPDEIGAAARSHGVAASSSGQAWRPVVRMRGSLTGSAYTAALNQYTSPQTAASTSQGILTTNCGQNKN